MRRVKKRIRLKKWVKVCLFLIVIITFSFVIFRFVIDRKIVDNKNTGNFQLTNYVKTSDNVNLYLLDKNKYRVVGSVGKGVVLHVESVKNGYCLVKDLDDDYYVKYDHLNNYVDDLSYDDRYKKYIVFNYNIKTNDKTNFYDVDDNLVYSIDKGYSLPIIIKETTRYGVEFGGRLLYIKAGEGDLVENYNTDKHNISGVATLNYHAFYRDSNLTEKNNCNTEICHSDIQFKSHLDLIKENDILTIKVYELEKYMNGEIQLPKSVLITIDDGGRTDVAVDMLTNYKMYATIFMVTSWFDPKNYYVTDYIEIHSHSHNMHNTGVCPRGQGGGIQCLSEEEIQKDLSTSRSLLNNTKYFCYPFYEYNEYSIEQLKKAGFTMSFVGESSKGDNLAKVGGDMFRIPRFVIVTYTTLDDLENYFNGMK